MEINITITELERLLNKQKELVIKNLCGTSSYYNSQNTAGHSNSLPIDEIKFKEQGMASSFPNEFITLKKYIR